MLLQQWVLSIIIALLYRILFKEVRHYESFKYLHLGMLSPIPRKSLPAIARAVGLKDGAECTAAC